MSKVDYGANRRGSRRRPPKGSTKVRCHRGPLGLGADLAISTLDVSETGANLVVKESFHPGEDLEISLEGVVHRRPITKTAVVVWCVPTDAGCFAIGVRFHGTLRYADLNDLARI